MRKYFSPLSSSSLSCDDSAVVLSLLTLLLVVHEEEGERDLRTVAVVKPARGMTIRFLGNAYA
jgi:hypothetical protein